MAKRHPVRSALLIALLLLVVMLTFVSLLHTHADIAALPVVCLLVVCAVLPVLLRTETFVRKTTRPLQPSLRRVLIQLPPPTLLA